MDREGPTRDTLLRAEPGRFCKAGNEFRPAIRVARIIERIDADEYVAAVQSAQAAVES